MSANSFMSGFTGGMTAMNSMMDSAEKRQLRQKQLKEQENQRNFSAMLHLYNGADDEQKQGIQADFVNKMNSDPAIQQLLSRNVGHNEQKRISSQFGQFTKDGFVPLIDVFDGRTGEVIRTAPMTEFGNSDGSDKPVALSNDDLINMVGGYLGKDDFGKQLEAKLIQAGGEVPESHRQEVRNGMLVNINEKTNQATALGKAGGGMANPYDWGKPVSTFTNEGRRIETYNAPNGRVMAKIFNDPDDISNFEVHDVTERMNPRNAGNMGDDDFANYFLGDPDKGGDGQPKPEPEPDEEPKPEPKPGGMEEEDKGNKEKTSWFDRLFSGGAKLTDKRNSGSTGNPYLQDEATRQKYKSQRDKAEAERPGWQQDIDERREQAKTTRAERNRRIAQSRSNIRPFGGAKSDHSEPADKPSGNEQPSFDQILAEARQIGDTNGKEAMTEYLQQFDETTQRKLTKYFFEKSGMEV